MKKRNFSFGKNSTEGQGEINLVCLGSYIKPAIVFFQHFIKAVQVLVIGSVYQQARPLLFMTQTTLSVERRMEIKR